MAEKFKNPYLCIFGGGAIRGLAYIGALQAMEEAGLEIKAFAGSSVGAVFAVFAAMNYEYDAFKAHFDEVNFDLFRDVQFNLAKSFAISKGEHFLNWIRAGIEKKFYGENYQKGKNQPVTFKDIDKDVFVITTNINGREPYIFSKYTTPDFEVAQAVRISTGLPGLLPPFNHEEKVLIDGDMMKSLPMWKTNELLCPEDCRIIEFRLEGAKCWPNVKNSVEYLNAVFATMSNFATDNIIQTYQPKDKFDYVKIDTEHILPVQFQLPQSERESLIDLGYKTTKEYLEKTLVEKKKELLPHYSVTLDHLIKIRNGLRTNQINKSKEELCDMFVYLCEAKQYIDSKIYDNILKFKILFFENITESLFLHRLSLKDKKQIEPDLEKLINTILEKCMELEAYIKKFE